MLQLDMFIFPGGWGPVGTHLERSRDFPFRKGMGRELSPARQMGTGMGTKTKNCIFHPHPVSLGLATGPRQGGWGVLVPALVPLSSPGGDPIPHEYLR